MTVLGLGLVAEGTATASRLMFHSVVRGPTPSVLAHSFAGTTRGGTVVFRLRGLNSCSAKSGSVLSGSRKTALKLATLNRAIRRGVLRLDMSVRRSTLQIVCRSLRQAVVAGAGGKRPTRRSTPVNTSAPTVYGTPMQGNTLAAANGSWANGPTGYSYQWQDCDSSGGACADISGATSATYMLQVSDVGDTVRSVVHASNSYGGATSDSPVTAVVQSARSGSPPPGSPPVNTSVPAVGGTTKQGDALTTTIGSWSNSPTSYSYQWQDCNSSGGACVNISGATSLSYTLQASDVGDTVRSVVQAVNSYGNESAQSAVTGTVQPSGGASGPPAKTSAPTVSGTDTQGNTLSAAPGSWSNGPTSYSYQWQDCSSSGAACVEISGATSSSYTLTGSDIMDTIRVKVMATNAQGSGGPASSSATNLVAGSYSCTKYASPSGSNSNSGTASSPYADIAYLESSLSPGQTGCLESGTYGNASSATEYDLTASGASGSPITIAPAPGATPHVIGWLVLDGDWITLEYLNIDGSNTAYSASAGINPLSNPVSAAMEVNGSHDVFQYNDFYQSVASRRGVGILVGDNYNGHFPTGDIIRYNDLHTVGNPGNTGSYGAYDHIIYDDAGTSTQIYGNWMWGDPVGYCIQLYPDTSNDSITSNVCDSVGSGINLANDGGSTASNNNVLSHNVFSNLTGLTANGTGGQGILTYWGGSVGTGEFFENSDVYNAPSGIDGGDSSGVTLTNNVTANPLFVNAAANDYQLQSGSTASGYGLWNGLGAAPPVAGF